MNTPTTSSRGARKISDAFNEALAHGEKALCPFLCAGYPQPGTLAKTLPLLQEAGATMVEIGVPFSDPIADGPVIAGAMHEALEQGATPDSVLNEIKRARDAGCTLPAVLMASVSLIEHAGAEAFAERAIHAGVDGLILPDCPLEEAPSIANPLTDAGLAVSLLVAPTSSPERARAIADACSGFVYVLTRTGITGQNTVSSDDPIDALRVRVEQLRDATDLPLACGFGIATADDVHRVVHGAGADGAIVGTALVRAMGEASRAGSDPADAASALTRQLVGGCGAR